MVDTATVTSVWSLNGTTSTLACGKLSGELDVARPHIGLHQREFDSDATLCTFFGVMRAPESQLSATRGEPGDSGRWPLAVADCYVRGNDLVATYNPADAWPYAPQIYWRADRSTTATSLESMSLLVSVQTPLLDTHPRILVTSQIPASELAYISIGDDHQAIAEILKSDRTIMPSGQGCCVVRRLMSAPFSYVEFMPSTDFQQLNCSLGPAGKLLAEWHLFSEFLEKGVIRRARVHGTLLPRENDIELAIECCSAFERSPLPLTV